MELNDRIRGALTGFAYGDALGLGTEFMTQDEAAHYYPEGCRHFTDIVRDAHRIQWKPGEWTNDTDVLIVLLESILEEGGLKLHRFSRRFKEWRDSEDRDQIPCVRACCADPDWLDHPMATARRVWHNSGIYEASNEALGRAIATGLTIPDETLNNDTCRVVLMTHNDSRCSTSAAVIARMTRSLLLTGEPAPIEELDEVCDIYDRRTLPFLYKAYQGDIDDLDIDDPETMQWTRKTMGAALWALWHHDNAADMIHSLVDLGGDADTNASIAGAFAGLRYGYDAIPEEKEQLIGLKKILDLSDRLTEYIEHNILN